MSASGWIESAACKITLPSENMTNWSLFSVVISQVSWLLFRLYSMDKSLIRNSAMNSMDSNMIFCIEKRNLSGWSSVSLTVHSWARSHVYRREKQCYEVIMKELKHCQTLSICWWQWSFYSRFWKIHSCIFQFVWNFGKIFAILLRNFLDFPTQEI